MGHEVGGLRRPRGLWTCLEWDQESSDFGVRISEGGENNVVHALDGHGGLMTASVRVGDGYLRDFDARHGREAPDAVYDW